MSGHSGQRPECGNGARRMLCGVRPAFPMLVVLVSIEGWLCSIGPHKPQTNHKTPAGGHAVGILRCKVPTPCA
eukprot:scaffold6162_cov116-Isochrysis_galbana.AAC.4